MAFKDLLPSPDKSSSSTSTTNSNRRKVTPPHRNTSRTPSDQLIISRPAAPPPRSNMGPPPIQTRPMPPFRASHIINPLTLRVHFSNAPHSWTTLDIHAFFEQFGVIGRIEIYDRDRRTSDTHGVVFFQPALRNASWVGRSLPFQDLTGKQTFIATKNDSKKVFWYPSPNSNRELPELITVPLSSMEFGVMQQEDKMLVLHTAEPTSETKVELSMNLQHKELHITFPVAVPYHPSSEKRGLGERHFKLRITPAQIVQAFMLSQADGSTSVVFTIDTPPLVFRKTKDIEGTHDSKATLWDERKTWLRQTDIDLYPWDRKSAIQLRKTNTIIETGRWLTYRVKFTAGVVGTPEFRDLCQALADHNVNMTMNRNIEFTFRADPDALWDWLEPARTEGRGSADSSLSEMQEMVDDIPPLPFAIRYQLEVCISLGVLHECNLTRDFLRRLAAVDPLRAVKILEKVADRKTRYFKPADVLALHNQVSVVEKKRPGYCTKIPSVTITPTTMYQSTPVLETSNRVIRHYEQYEDRFLRVRFTDERYKGRIMSADDYSMNEVFSRVKRAMTQGINIGGRHYEFLAFGNSQFRDHGAYFFASTSGVTAADIRDWMGDFTNIRVIAKYVSRLGQCFSTTRAIPLSVTVQKIADVERNGFCFTDGVGKISPFLARMIAHHYAMANFEYDYPSVFQIRLAGCKGVLAVDPSLKGSTIQIRPSQQKFPAKSNGLEICRISQFSTASLNVQLILVLSALGVPDEVFLKKLRVMLADLQEALDSEQKALELLQKNIDFNQMTISLACMIFDGFMATNDPFVITCLRLWRSWNLKYLKEKARIFIDQGAFLLGCTDESATLRGHFKSVNDSTGTLQDQQPTETDVDKHDISTLPEIFLQIPDAERAGSYKVVEGVVVLARNPSLHPGDIRVVKAVDNAALRPLRNCVVLPQTGDRDVANMCSGGDLDGDDFIVIWDKDLIPPEWNHDPMDYTPPDPVLADGAVTVDNMTSFFVQHIKNDILSRIACAHRYWADQLPDGIKDPKCLHLAQLHSKAVDYPKTGVPAKMPADLRVQRWPHWSEPRNKAQSKVYQSNKVLGKLYDEVKKEPFHAAWEMPFDERILTACEPSDQMLKDARDIKALFDEAIRRIMTQHGIKTEFEVFTTFVLEHHQEIGDYKFAETMGEITTNLKQQHQDLCYNRAGTDSTDRDWEKMKPFIVAMYKITAEEIGYALKETKIMHAKGGRDVPQRALTFETMPLMSFPWIFATELGRIATKGHASALAAMPKPNLPKSMTAMKKNTSIVPDDWKPAPLAEVNISNGVVREGDLLDLLGDDPVFSVGENKTPLANMPDLLASINDEEAALSLSEAASPQSSPEMLPLPLDRVKAASGSVMSSGAETPATTSSSRSVAEEGEVEFECTEGGDGNGTETAFNVQESLLDRLGTTVGMVEIDETEN